MPKNLSSLSCEMNYVGNRQELVVPHPIALSGILLNYIIQTLIIFFVFLNEVVHVFNRLSND